MKQIVIITGGLNKISADAVKRFAENNTVIWAGSASPEFEQAAAEASVKYYPVDVRDINSMEKLAESAVSEGDVKAVLNIPEASETSESGADILNYNAAGTVNTAQAFAKATENITIYNFSGREEYLPDKSLAPGQVFKMSLTDTSAMIGTLCHIIPASQLSKYYQTSLNYILWYTTEAGKEYSEKGINMINVAGGAEEISDLA